MTGTDTGVGKTIVTAALGLLLQERKFKVGVMKPVQCGGHDAQFFKKILAVNDPFKDINPYYAPEPLSPHLAFQRNKQKISVNKILELYERLKERYDCLLIEGAGGLMVPLKDNYLVADLIRAMGCEVIIVSRLGLGTINHSLLTIDQCRQYGLPVRGIIFNQTKNSALGISEQTNPEIVCKKGGVTYLGTVPFLKNFERSAVIKKCRSRIKIDILLKNVSKDRTKELIEDDKNYLWHPFTQMKDWLNNKPLIIERGQGSHLIDTEGNKYLDGVSSLWVNVHGHRHKTIDRALKEQIDRLSHSTLLGLSNAPAVQLAKSLVEITPPGLEKVFYSDNGSTAVEVALKIAYQYWQNIGCTKKIHLVHLANSYHGDTLGSVSVGGIDFFHKVYRDLIFKTIAVDFPDCYRLPKGKKYPDYAFECLDNLGRLLKKKHDSIAALVVEPIVQGAAGMIVWPSGILRKMRALCRKFDVIMIADEVATGFGRTGKMFASEHEGVSPDILCLAKGLTGGYLPLAATLTTKKIFDGFLFDYKDQKTFFHGHTYTGNPLSCAAALANIEVFQKEKTLSKLQPKIKFLGEKLKMFYNLAHVGQVRQKGFMVGIELVKDRSTKEPYDWEERVGVRVCQKVRERGVILRPLGNVVVLMPPLSIRHDELEKILDVTYWAVEKITGNRQ